MILVAALAEKSSAETVSAREAKMPFGGFQIPVDGAQDVHGDLYILCGLVEQKSSSAALLKMDPWPMWELVCGKLFRTEAGKIYSVRYVSPARIEVPLTSKAVQDVVNQAVEGLNQLPEYQRTGAVHKLASVISVERQTVDQAYFKELALSQIPNDVQVFYVYFLTSDTASDSAPANAHMCAIVSTLSFIVNLSGVVDWLTVLRLTDEDSHSIEISPPSFLRRAWVFSFGCNNDHARVRPVLIRSVQATKV
jgi:hypothetical protein